MKGAKPEWALKLRRKGTEIQVKGGRYYLYEVSSHWDKEKKRSVKRTGALVGSITEEGGFVESPKRVAERAGTVVVAPSIREYGASRLVEDLASVHLARLKEFFPTQWEMIFAAAFVRLASQSPIKNMAFHFNHSFLSERLSVSLSDKNVSKLLRELGLARPRLVEYMRSFLGSDDYLLMDQTQVVTHSRNLPHAKPGYSNAGGFDPQVGLMYIFSAKHRCPAYYHLGPGNIKEVKAMRNCIDESGVQDAVVVADKGFHSKANVEALAAEKLGFIIPLKRTSRLIDYGPTEKPGKKGFGSYFVHEGRHIWYADGQSDDGRVILFLDDTLRATEERDYLYRAEKHPETHSLEKFHDKQNRMGTIAMLTSLADKAPEYVYKSYKARAEIEVMFDALKNILDADRTYMQDEEAMEGWFFINHLALVWYYEIYKLLLSQDMLAKYSPADLLQRLAEVRKVSINGKWVTSDVIKSTETLLSKLNIPIT
jgi:Transposase DDE domain